MNETLKCDMCDQWNIKAGQKVFSCRARECMEEGGFDVCGACGEGDADTPLEQPQPEASDDRMPDIEPPEVVEQAAAVELANAQPALPPVAPALMAGVEPPAAPPARPPRASRRRADTGSRGGVAVAGPVAEGGMHVETEPEAPGSATKAHEGMERAVRRRRAVNFSD